MATVTVKNIQLHAQCNCGFGSVEHIKEQISYKEFKAFGVKRKKDKRNGGWFLLKNENYESCYNCSPDC